MCKGDAAHVLSNVELILPWNVVEACYNLERNDSTNFFATNEVEATTSQISLCKLEDNSIRIQVTVTAYEPDETEDDVHGSSGQKSPDKRPEYRQQLEDAEANEEPVVKRKRGRPRKSNSATPETATSERVKNHRNEGEEDDSRSGRTYPTRSRGNEPAMPVLQAMDEEERLLGPEDISLDMIYKYGPMMKAYEDQKKKEQAAWEHLQQQVKKIREGQESVIIIIKGEVGDDDLINRRIDKEYTIAEIIHDIQPAEGEGSKDGQAKLDEYLQGPDGDPTEVVCIRKQSDNNKDEYVVEDEDGRKRKFFKRRRDVATRVAKDSITKDQPVWKTPQGKKTVRMEGSYKRESPANIRCKFCPRLFKDHCYLFRHVKAHHPDNPKVKEYLEEIKPQMKVQCPICDKSISNIGNINNHMKQCHPDGDVSVKCEACNKWYKTPASLKQHMRQRHSMNPKKITCPQCDVQFTDRRGLRDHINCVHETTQVFTCTKCWKVFLTKSRLRRHMYIHGDHRHICQQCGKGFHIKDNMNKHIRIVHEKNDGKMWRCSYCSKEFLVKGNLTQHIRGIHLKQFPFTCSKCQQGFRRMKDMMIHMEKCTAEEPDNLEMFSTPVTSRRGRGGGRSSGRSSTPRVGRGRGWSRRRSEDDDTPDTSDEEEEEEEEDFNEDDLDDEEEDEDEEEEEEPEDEETQEQDEEGKQHNGKDGEGKEGAKVSKYEEEDEDEGELYEEEEEATGDGPHQEIVLTTSGTGDGALEFQLEQDGMVIPIEVVIDQNESTEDTKNGETVAEVIADGTKE
ncbi:hypothetical protein LSH36_145g07000 [Paralvinella palmiformis]|uniref:C2H2-type domain-containing protein n=1 Tax=Paralvinella palmiformis TaxID=53620 RepID=A0AAD9NAA2_9ANNE|nr:hypothetical protein LSH36_145g07000 [Paralvinella palmiformis]